MGMKGGRCTWPRGKVLGGSSTINAMVYVRGNQRDYDHWANMGNTGWDYDSVLESFKKFEHLLVPNLHGNYGTDGELGLTRYKCDQPIRGLLQETIEKLGVPRLDVEDKCGHIDSLMTINDGMRSNTAKVFLGAAKKRANLKMALKAHVTRISIDETTKTAKGVEVQLGDKLLRLNARKEVIISAGAINSPQILMLSGVGPRAHLEGLNINVVQDLPVGEHLEDHLTFCGLYLKIDESAVVPLQPHEILTELYKYFAFQMGAFTEISLTNFMYFINTKNDSIWPNVQFHHTLHFKNEDYLLPTFWQTIDAQDEIRDSVLEHNKRYNLLGIYPTLLSPKSNGRILLNTTNPFDHPLIHTNYLTNDEDVKVLIEAIRFVQQLMATDPFNQHNPEIVPLDIPNCAVLPFDGDAYWECVLRNTAKTLYHPTGTCQMGPNGVVDAMLKVHGVKGLRVIDASIMPKIVSANTNAASIMIGQKGAEFIIKEYGGDRHEEL